MHLSRSLGRLTKVFLSVPCPLCQRPTSSVLCTDCYRQIQTCQWPSSTRGKAAQNTSAPGLTLYDGSALSVLAWGRYQGVLKQVLALLKYGDQTEIGLWLGRLLGQHWQASQRHTAYRQLPVVVPIPLHQKRQQQRGYNQAALIAAGFCRVTGLSLIEHGLVRIKATEAMHGLGINARKTNLADAFRLGTGLPSTARQILLIDDIYTTGTTAQAAVIPLIQAGYTVAGIATVARAVFVSRSV
ncbi:MAG: ComF family protein [Cyanobacteria bacterium P01_H01_bin.26]